ncbi:hypothetical protein PSHT_11639 [Puccinia striiformis]|uniref:Uncharacterized protein n=1 Tax=Puccinia striiformis TaxID=27350 RepID=A0A2S4V231_9BASI|nr:hypothetical protein PSHT_11639 [Puccinia striiformis]
MINTSHGSYAQHDCQRPSPSHPYAAIKQSIKAVSPSSACERTCCESKHVRYAPPFIRLMRYIPSAKFNLLPAAFLPFVGPRQIHFALASPQSNKSLIIRVNTPFFGPPLLPKQQASPLNPSYGAELTAQGLRQHLSHHQISSKSADHFPELLELFAECAEELPVARSHQDNPGIRRSARIRAIMDTPKEATGPSSRFNETHSTSMSNKRALGLSEGGSAVCMGPHITRDSPDVVSSNNTPSADPERSKGKGAYSIPKPHSKRRLPSPTRDSKAPKKRSNLCPCPPTIKAMLHQQGYHRGNKASSKQIADDQTLLRQTSPSREQHPSRYCASGDKDTLFLKGSRLEIARRNEFSVPWHKSQTIPTKHVSSRQREPLGYIDKEKKQTLLAHWQILNPALFQMLKNMSDHYSGQQVSPVLKLPNIQVWAKVRRSLPPIVTGGAEVLEQVGLTEQTPDCSRLSSNSATPAVEEQHSNPTPVALCGIAVPRFDSTIPPLHVKHEHDLCLSVTPSPCQHQPPVLQEVIPSLVSPESSSLPQALFNLQEGPISPFVPTPWGCSLPSHDEECWCMHSPQAPESPECTPRILFELPSPSAPEPKQQTSDLLEGTGQNHSLEMHTAPVDSPFFCISPRTLSNTPFPGTPLSMGRTVGKHPIGHLEDNQGNHLKITMPTIQLSHGSNSTNTDRSNLPLDQFLLSPLLVHDQVNPRQPILEFDGSNYLIWQVAIDQTLSYVTHQEGPFVSKISSFSTLPMSESRSIEVLIRNTIDPKLLVILDSRKLQTPGEMCELLNRMYQPTNRRHKLNAIKSLNKLIKCNRTISERWVVDWHQTYFEISQLKLSNDEFMGLFFQASLNLPNEVDPTVLDSLTNRRLENHPNPTFDQVSTEMFHILLDLRFKLDKTLEEPFEAEKPKVVDHKKKDNEDGQKREGKGKESSERRGVSP